MDEPVSSMPMVEKNNETNNGIGSRKSQETWGSKVEYLLSLLGNCVGYNNIWRFPYVCMKNGGGAFLIPYLFFILVCGIPLFYLEAAIAQYSGKSAYHVWDICPLFKGLGIGIFIMVFTICAYYNMISAWILYYFVNSFFNPMPWTSCDNDWNTEFCYDGDHVTNLSRAENFTAYENGTTGSLLLPNRSDARLPGTTGSLLLPNRSDVRLPGVTPEEEFWRNGVLEISKGIHEVGHLNWYIVACLAVSWICVYIAVLYGIKSVGKVVYLTAISPYILLTIILIRGLTLPGSFDGIRYYLEPDFTKLLEFGVWMEAAVQMFFSLGPGWGGILTMACHNKFNNKFYRDTIILSLAGEGTSIFGGFVTFSILGYIAYTLQVPISKLATSGPGMIFIVYPEALGEIPLPNLWAVLFFLMMFFVGLDSQFVQFETITTIVEDARPILKKPRNRAAFRAITSVILFLIGLLFCTQGGVYFFQIADWYICSVFPLFIGIIECVIVAWVYGIDRFDSDVRTMVGDGTSKFILFSLCFITPGLLAGVLLAVLIMYTPPKYGNYVYPATAKGVGWVIGLAPVLAVLIIAVYTVIKTEGKTLKKKILKSIKPSDNWRPDCEVDENKDVYISGFAFWKSTLKMKK